MKRIDIILKGGYLQHCWAACPFPSASGSSQLLNSTG
jgi:hypothetical protein